MSQPNLAVSYRPGGLLAVIVPGCWLLLGTEPAPKNGLAQRCWEVMQEAADAERILRTIDSRRADLRGFALLARGDGGWVRAVARGEMQITVQSTGMDRLDDVQEVDERFSWLIRGFRLGKRNQRPASIAVALPLAAGVALAEEIVGGQLTELDARMNEVGLPGLAPEGSVAAPAAERSGDSGRTFYPRGAGTVPQQRHSDVKSAAADAALPDSPNFVSHVQFASVSGPGTDPRQHSEEDIAHTQLNQAQENGHIQGLAQMQVQRPVWPPEHSMVSPKSDEVRRGDDSQGDNDREGDRDDEIEHTVFRGSSASGNQAASTGRPNVSAVRCAGGHLNPPQAERCRLCPQPVPPQQEIQVARPLLGVLRLSTGGDIPLDRDVLMGRDPSSDRPPSADKPHLLRLPSPGKDISRTHLEIRLLGWRVMVIDLGSTNGTSIRPPGGSAEQIAPRSVRVIEPGTEVTLAGVLSFIYEAAG